MAKIWAVKFGGYAGSKNYKSETAFLDAITDNHDRATVTIYEEVEPAQSALEYKRNIITQRDREQQLSVLLDDNQEVKTIGKIREEIKKINTEGNKWVINDIMKKFDSRGLSIKTFKNLVTSANTRLFLLYKGPNSVEWYKLLLSVHKFQMDEEYYAGYKKTQKVDTDRFENFKKAKEELRLENKKVK